MNTTLIILGFFTAVPVVALMTLGVFFMRATWHGRAASQLPEDVPSALYDGPMPIDARLYPRQAAVWALSIALALIYIAAGLPKLGGFEPMLHRFEALGFSADFLRGVGALEFLGAVFLLIPRAAFWAASGLMVIMFGSIATHAALGEPALAVIPATCLMALGTIAWARRPRWLGRRDA